LVAAVPVAESPLEAVNLAVKFALELAAIAAFALWGAAVGHGLLAVVLAVLAPLCAIVLWGRFAAPRAPNRLPVRLRVPFELGVFALAALALLNWSSAAAIAFSCVVIVNAVLLTVFSQWEA
jgi:hypothetical protein